MKAEVPHPMRLHINLNPSTTAAAKEERHIGPSKRTPTFAAHLPEEEDEITSCPFEEDVEMFMKTIVGRRTTNKKKGTLHHLFATTLLGVRKLEANLSIESTLEPESR